MLKIYPVMITMIGRLGRVLKTCPRMAFREAGDGRQRPRAPGFLGCAVRPKKAEYEVAPACKTKLSLCGFFLLLDGLLPTASMESRAVSIEYSRSRRIG